MLIRIADGWELRFTADARRAQEAVELYAQLGYEVRVEPMRAQDDECGACCGSVGIQAVYTRRRHCMPLAGSG